MKALITGISGFAGSFLAEQLLSQNYEVAGITRPNSPDFKNLHKISERISLHELDLLDFGSVSKLIINIKPDVVFHLAALPSPSDSFKNPSQYLTNNISAELNILEAVRVSLLNPKILIVSSAEVYGAVNNSDLPIDEKTPLAPASPYAVSKVAQDYLGLQYFLTYKMNIVRVRPFNHIGPRQAPGFVVSSFAKQISEIEKGKHEPVMKVGNLDAKRDFTDVRDMVRAYTLILEKGENGEVYNIGSGVSHKIKEILNILLSFSTAKIEVKVDESLLRPVDIPDIYCGCKKFEKATGWRPEIPLEQSLKDSLEYWRENV